MCKVKFFSKNDMSCGYYLSKAETIIKNFDETKDFLKYGVIDIIELYNIKLFIDLELYLKSWSSEYIDFIKAIVKKFTPIIGQFFNSISEDNLKDLYLSLDFDYNEDYWTLMEKYKIYKKISQDAFYDLISHPEVSLRIILKHRKITNYYGATIAKRMLEDTASAEILLEKFEMSHNSVDEINLPNELTSSDKEKIIYDYIGSIEPSLTCLRLIVNTKEFSISDLSRYNAKKRAEAEEARIFEKSAGLTMETVVTFSKNQDEERLIKREGQNWYFSYSLKWLQDNDDYPTLLNNFIYLFEYVDLQMRITCINNGHEMGVFERITVSNSKNAYKTGIAFKTKNMLAQLQMIAYHRELSNMNIRLEEVIEWFFKYYINDEFGIDGFRIKLPSAQSLYFEKCRAVLPEIESALKQFRLLVLYDSINHDLLQMSSSKLPYKEVPSLLENKYVYGCGDEYNKIIFLFFSDQCALSFSKEKAERYSNFFDLILNENSCIDDYLDFHRPSLDWLLEKSYILIDEKRMIKPCYIEQLQILKDLNKNEFINYWRYSSNSQAVIMELYKKGIVRFENSLLSIPEQNYLNYYLNKSSFNNALDLRNMYSHGTQPSGEGNENIHEQNYMTFLRLFILIIIKINDELCIKHSGKNSCENIL